MARKRRTRQKSGLKSPFPTHMLPFFDASLPGFIELLGSRKCDCPKRNDAAVAAYIKECAHKFMSIYTEELNTTIYKQDNCTKPVAKWKGLYKRKYTNFKNNIWVKGKRTASRSLVSFIKRVSKLTGYQLFLQLKSHANNYDLDDDFADQLISKVSTKFPVGKYQKVMRKKWGKFTDEEKLAFDSAADEINNLTTAKSDSDLRIIENRLALPSVMVELFQGLIGFEERQVGTAMFHVFIGWRDGKTGAVEPKSLTISESDDVNFMDEVPVDMRKPLMDAWTNCCEGSLPAARTCDDESNDESDDESEVEDEYDIYLEPPEEGFPYPRLLLDVSDLSKEMLLTKLSDYLHDMWVTSQTGCSPRLAWSAMAADPNRYYFVNGQLDPFTLVDPAEMDEIELLKLYCILATPTLHMCPPLRFHDQTAAYQVPALREQTSLPQAGLSLPSPVREGVRLPGTGHAVSIPARPYVPFGTLAVPSVPSNATLVPPVRQTSVPNQAPVMVPVPATFHVPTPSQTPEMATGPAPVMESVPVPNPVSIPIFNTVPVPLSVSASVPSPKSVLANVLFVAQAPLTTTVSVPFQASISSPVAVQPTVTASTPIPTQVSEPVTGPAHVTVTAPVLSPAQESAPFQAPPTAPLPTFQTPIPIQTPVSNQMPMPMFMPYQAPVPPPHVLSLPPTPQTFPLEGPNAAFPEHHEQAPLPPILYSQGASSVTPVLFSSVPPIPITGIPSWMPPLNVDIHVPLTPPLSTTQPQVQQGHSNQQQGKQQNSRAAIVTTHGRKRKVANDPPSEQHSAASAGGRGKRQKKLSKKAEYASNPNSAGEYI